MDEAGRSRDRAGRRAKRFLTPVQKYEIYLQVIRGQVTMAAAGVDRTTVVRIRQDEFLPPAVPPSRPRPVPGHQLTHRPRPCVEPPGSPSG